ncbi:MAG: hypothetical protein H6705_15500 [Myxococcales bacterium]|nr:hypothetical protein [Myxococcales bacterium]
MDPLPPRLQALLDPAIPLARPERLVPGGLIGPGEPFAVLMLSGAFGLGLAAAALYAWAVRGETGAVDPAGLYVAPALVVVAAAFGWRAWRRLVRARAQRDALGAGRWRTGIFVEDDGLLLSGPPPRWVPRAAIDAVAIEDGRVVMRCQEGMIALDGPAAALGERLRVWRETGRFAWEERV